MYLSNRKVIPEDHLMSEIQMALIKTINYSPQWMRTNVLSKKRENDRLKLKYSMQNNGSHEKLRLSYDLIQFLFNG